MQNKIVAVLGGSGFLGRYVVERLARHGALIKVGCRDPQEAMHLQPMGTVGQIKVQQVNIRDDQSVARFVSESDIVINLVGILFEKGKQTFKEVHVSGAERVARLAFKAGVSRFIHVSALGSDLQAISHYSQTKAEGEQGVLREFPEASIVRPSLLYGAEDHFFQRFAQWATISPFLPVLGEGTTLFQPVYVGDVAESVVKIAQKQHCREIFEIAGAKTYTFRDLLTLIMETINCHRLLIPVPTSVGYVLGAFGQLLPHPPLTIDQVRLFKQGYIASGKHKTIEDLGISPYALEALLPQFLSRFRR